MEGTMDTGFDVENEADYFRPAGFWMRFWAYTVDIIMVWCINGILLSPFKFVNDGAPMMMGIWSIEAIISVIVLYGYFVLMTKFYGQTLGKMIFGLQVVRKDDHLLTWSDILFREVIGRFLYRVLSVLTLLYIVVAFDPLKQGVHDMLSDTRVIHT